MGVTVRTATRTVVLRPVTDEGVRRYRDAVFADYVGELVTVAGMAPDAAAAKATVDTDSQLPATAGDPSQMLLDAYDGDDYVGAIWIARQAPHNIPGAWVNDVRVAPTKRGAGYGKAIMRAAEELLAAEGVSELGLSVFAHNQVAREMYVSLGYSEVCTFMRRELTTPA